MSATDMTRGTEKTNKKTEVADVSATPRHVFSSCVNQLWMIRAL